MATEYHPPDDQNIEQDLSTMSHGLETIEEEVLVMEVETEVIITITTMRMKRMMAMVTNQATSQTTTASILFLG